MPPSEHAGEDDGVSFKPFFDMVVGVLFVLLILVAAQMFFTQWEPASPAASRQEQMRQLSVEWERQIAEFLTGLSGDLEGRGIRVGLDLTDRSLVLPLSGLVHASGEGGASIRRDQASAVAQATARNLRCLPGQPAEPAGAVCRSLPLLRLGRVEAEVRVAGAPPAAALPADRYGKLVATLLLAEFLKAAPDLLAVTGGSGGPALQGGSTVLAATAGSPEPAGDLLLRFTFSPPAL